MKHMYTCVHVHVRTHVHVDCVAHNYYIIALHDLLVGKPSTKLDCTPSMTCCTWYSRPTLFLCATHVHTMYIAVVLTHNYVHVHVCVYAAT